MSRHDYTAISEEKNAYKDRKIYNRLKYPRGSVPSSKQISVPLQIQYIMNYKQYQHSRPQPLVKVLSGNLVRHKKKKRYCHQKINQNFYFHFCFHLILAFQNYSGKPSSAIHSSILLSASGTLEPHI